MTESSNLKWKIDKLLHVDTPVYETERILIALLLWTRASDYKDLWEVHPHLIPWIINWAQKSSSSPLFLRLVAQVYLHCDTTTEPRLEPLGRILLNAWKVRDMAEDVPAAVLKWLEQKQDRDEVLRELVVYQLILSDRDDEKQNITLDNKDELDAEIVFQETLRQLLDQNSSSCVSSQEWASLFFTESSGISYWTPLLQWWIENENPNKTRNSIDDEPQRRRLWATVLLETVMKYLASKNDRENQMDWQVDVNIARTYAKFLMICVVDPNDTNDDSSIRTLAWSAIAVSVEASGWDWMLHSSSSSRLGKAHNMCTFVRLAAGEWKIQLERSLQENVPADDTIRTIQACTRVLAHGFAHLQEIAADEDTRSRSFSPEALLHLRRSMEETMHTTVEYLTTKDVSKSLEISKAAVCLFGPFLTEWDVFLERNTEVMLKALAFSVDLCKDDFSAQINLVAGLTAVLASSEGDDSRIDALNQFQLLDQRLEDFLISCFDQIENDRKDHNNQDRTLQWCSQIIDLWTSLVEDRKTTRILECVRSRLKRALAQSASDSTIAVSCLAFCYITLQGDAPPSDEDAALLKIALERVQPMD